jgi:hypothetical protein
VQQAQLGFHHRTLPITANAFSESVRHGVG